MMDVAFAFQCNIWWKFTKITPTAELMEYLLSFSEVSLSHERQWLSKKNLFLSREIKEIRGAYAYECSCWPTAWSGTKFSRLCPRSVPVDEETVPPSWTLSNAWNEETWYDGTVLWQHNLIIAQGPPLHHICSVFTIAFFTVHIQNICYLKKAWESVFWLREFFLWVKQPLDKEQHHFMTVENLRQSQTINQFQKNYYESISCNPFERKIKQMQPVWLWILWCRPFEETFENPQWRKVKQMQPMRLCNSRRHLRTQWGK